MSKALLTDLGSGKAYLLDGDTTIGRDNDNGISCSRHETDLQISASRRSCAAFFFHVFRGHTAPMEIR